MVRHRKPQEGRRKPYLKHVGSLCILAVYEHGQVFLDGATCLIIGGQDKIMACQRVLVACPQKDQFLVYAQENGGAVLAIVLLGSTVALAYNVTHNLLLKRTSSVAVRPLIQFLYYHYTCSSPSPHGLGTSCSTIMAHPSNHSHAEGSKLHPAKATMLVTGRGLLLAALLPHHETFMEWRMSIGGRT